MTNIIDLSKHASKKKDIEIVSAFSKQFSLDAQQDRFRRLLVQLLEENAHLGRDRLSGELTGALMFVEAMPAP